MAPRILIDDVEVAGRPGQAVVTGGGRILRVGPRQKVGAVAGAGVRIDGAGGALTAGLHDHHLHLFATAAHRASLWCGAPEVSSPRTLAARLAEAGRAEAGRARGPEGWIRAVGWDDSVSGWPDRADLDAAVADRPVRLQHRSGALWVLNSAALASLGLEADHPDGRLGGRDAWLAQRLGAEMPSLAEVSAELAARGVCGITDATAHNGPTELAALARASRDGEVVQSLWAMTADAEVSFPEGVAAGPVKLVVTDPEPPPFDELVARVVAAHAAGRPVALHAASRMGTVVATAVLTEAGPTAGDRVEHASVVPDELVATLARLGVCVVTQPHFVAERGAHYRAEVDPGDHDNLYRVASLLEAGVAVAAGSDAPVGGLDPWASMAAAVARRDATGTVLGPAERVSAEQALALFAGTADDPGGPARRVVPGEVADLCLLDRPWHRARCDLAAVAVRATLVRGHPVHLDG